MKPTRVVITGASSGIGKEMAIDLARRKVNLVLSARRVELLEELAQELRQQGVTVDVLALDLLKPGAAQTLLAFCQNGADIDGLINNAGAGPYRDFLSAPIESHQQVIQLNLVSLTELCHVFGVHMRLHGKQSFILNVASTASYLAVPKFAVYASSKFYVRVFSQILRHELQGTNVSVTCLCPGGTATEFLEKNNQQLKGSFSPLMSAEEVAQLGVAGALQGRAIVIPGFFNKLSCWLPRFVPMSWSIALAGQAMRLAVREKVAGHE